MREIRYGKDKYLIDERGNVYHSGSGSLYAKEGTFNAKMISSYGKGVKPRSGSSQPGPQAPSQLDQAKNRLVDLNRIPGFVSNPALTADGSSLRSDLMLGGYDPRGIQQIRNEALRSPGQASEWAQMALGKQGFEEQQGLNRIAQQMAGAQSQALSNLAMRGGLQSGARNRMAMQGARDQMMGMQDVRAQGINQRYDIGLQDEANRQKWLSGLAAQEEAYQAPQRFNITNQLATIGSNANNRNIYNRERYGLENDALSRYIQGTYAQK